MTKTFAALFAAVALSFASTAAAAEAPKAPITLPAKKGPVTFDHQKHLSNGVKCTACHKDNNGGAIEGFNKTVKMATAHATCQECHKKNGKGPTKCDECHKKA